MNILAENLPDILPGFLQARCESDSFFADVPIVLVYPGDTQSDLLAKINTLLGKAGKIGACLFILPVEDAHDEFENNAVGPLKLSITFQAWESPDINRLGQGTFKGGYKIARHTFALFKLFGVQGVCKLLTPDRPAIKRIIAPEGINLRGWEINFTTREDDQFVIPKLNRLTLTPSAGAASTVTITSPDAGALIYYTTDDSAPGSGNTSAKLYTIPIAVPAGGLNLFAASELSDWLPSNVSRGIFTKA